MKLFLLILTMLFTVVTQPALPQQANAPLTKNQVMDLVKFGMDSAQLANKIKERRIDFEPTVDYVAALRQAGAKDEVAQAVVGVSSLAQEAGPPLGQDQVMKLVKLGMESGELSRRIKARGLDFEPTDDYLESLRKAGAQEPVIQAILEVKPKPLTRDQVGELVAGGVPSQRAVTLVTQRGIDFLPDAEYLGSLQVAGASDELIAALRKAGETAKGELVVHTFPGAEVYLDGQLQGRADTQSQLTLRASFGEHRLRVSLKGKNDIEQSVTVAAHGTKLEVRFPPTSGEVERSPKDGLKYVWIPPGTFMMGCSPGDNECSSEEKPSHQVTISKGFWLCRTPVTAGAYKRLSAATGRQMPGAPNFNNGWMNENMPIVSVSWDDAQAYCGWIGGRLPTEAEWEYAARGGNTEARYGNLDDIAWYRDNSRFQAHDVAQKRPNGFGLYDMLGNVWQWVNDWYDQNFYQVSSSQDPQGPASGQLRVLRGGSWINIPRYLRVSFRYWDNPGLRINYVGFRCAGEVF